MTDTPLLAPVLFIEVVSFPTIVMEILNAMSGDNVTMNKVAALIETDVAMTTKILRVANSPFYGLRGTVKSVGNSVKMLGLGEKWGLPAEFTEVMRCHHAAKTAEVNPLLVALVRCADLLCEQFGHGIGERSGEYSFYEDESFDILQMTIPYFRDTAPENIKAAMAEDLEKNLEFIKIVG